MIRIPTVLRAACALVFVCALPARAEVFINEIHYDNSGAADVGEAVEVVATAGELLTQYSIVRYNGNGNTVYGTDSLPAGSDVSCGATVRIATLNYPQDGLQNGAPDGIALVGPGGLIQFLSYEGTMTGSGGAADGVTSTDIGVSETNSTAAGTSLQLGGSGTQYSDFSWNGTATATFDGCNNGQTFGAAVDNPPDLASSVPTDGAMDFPANANLVLTFTEAVNTDAGWFTLSCTTSGVLDESDIAVSGNDQVRTLDPMLDLAEAEECTLTLEASAISDRDGNLDLYVGDTRIVFTVAAPTANDPPAVLSTTPMDGDDDFPGAANLVVLFSEPVNLAAGAFTLACDTSTGIVLDYATSGTSFTVDTGTALIGGEHCVFTIDADAVTDVEGAHPSSDTVIGFDVASSSVGNYYAQVNTSSAEQLRCSLHQTIKGHTSYPYSAGTTDTWDILEIADEDPNDSSKILDAYRNESYAKAGGGNSNYNREHTWPNSLGFADQSLPAYTDTHMLYLTNIDYNSNRGNSPYASCSGCTERVTLANNGQGGGSGVYPGNSNWFDANSFEVWGARKGDMARAVMYMAIRYEGGDNLPDLELTDNRSLIVGTSSSAPKAYMGLLTTLLAWHQADPPNAAEIERNDVIYSFQGNRNPFIDHPEWATLALFQSSQPMNCELNTGNLPPEVQDDGYTVDEDATLTVVAPGVLGNDTDNEMDPFTAQLVSDVLHGVLTLQANGSFVYDPADDYCGADSFSYRAADATGTSATAIVSSSDPSSV